MEWEDAINKSMESIKNMAEIESTNEIIVPIFLSDGSSCFLPISDETTAINVNFYRKKLAKGSLDSGNNL